METLPGGKHVGWNYGWSVTWRRNCGRLPAREKCRADHRSRLFNCENLFARFKFEQG
jgi:hypothetical protein